MHIPKTLTEAIRYYSDEQVCIDTVAALRWPNGTPICPKCGTEENGRKHYWLAAQKRWKCYSCRKQFSVKVNSLFEDSPLSLDKWLIALWMLCNCKNGVSSHEIARELGIAQKSAWHLLHRLRSALQSPDGNKLGGEGQIVEMDETFIGGKQKNMHKNKKPIGTGFSGIAGGSMAKTIVVGMLDRNGRVKAEVVAARTREVLHFLAARHIADGSTLMTDEWKPYLGTAFQHEIINHAVEYARGLVHTNGIENFWALLKRGLHGTYINVEPFHLFRYIDEQAFRYEHRATKDKPYTNADRFGIALTQIGGKRLTWKDLTGKEEGSF
jgi:transposase-like protein